MMSLVNCVHKILLLFTFAKGSVGIMEATPKYDIVLSQETLIRLVTYKNDLHTQKVQPGSYLREILDAHESHLNQTSTERFIELLMLTKKPIIFAESEIRGGGSDWNSMELQLLGDLSVAMDVEIYDNGVWFTNNEIFRTHNPPLNGTLLFTPGPLLRGSIVGQPPDLNEVVNLDFGQTKRRTPRSS